MSFDSQKFLFSVLRTMLKPILRFCVRYTLHIQDIIEAVKVTLIEVSEEDLTSRGQSPNISRISAMTGLRRREVTRIFQQRDIVEEPRGIITRLIGQWQQDRRFSSKPGSPRVLTIEGPDSEFRRLCRAVSNDLNPGTMLLELERISAVERTSRGLKLIVRQYVARGNIREGFGMMARDVQDLMSAVNENVMSSDEIHNLHGHTEFDNVAPTAIPKIRKWLLYEGSVFHRKVRKFLGQFDRDLNSKASREGEGVRVAVTAFSVVDKRKES